MEPHQPFIDLLDDGNQIHQIPYGLSSFAALSGCRGKFETTEELFETKLHTILLDSKVLPDSRDFEHPSLNSYIVDFYLHGSQKRVNKENEMKNPNETDKMLRRMSKDLKKVRTQLHLVLDEEDHQKDPFFQILNEITNEFSNKYTKIPKRMRKKWLPPELKLDDSPEDSLIKEKPKEDYMFKNFRQRDEDYDD
jgi:hypothetical protein